MKTRLMSLLKCPEGVVHEDLFKDIYSKFFPHGNSNLYAHFVFKAFDVKSNGAISFKLLGVWPLFGFPFSRCSKALKLSIASKMMSSQNSRCETLQIPADMLMTLSTLLRGSIYEKLRWTFKLYDLNGDGCITRSELSQIVLAIHELMGKRPQGRGSTKSKDHTDMVFQKLDINQDGVITFEEFIESCLKDEAITKSLQVFDSRSL
ncbi:hypothetical protein AGLY_013035 [Aphis glycines]|uniref:EF-hand domain-containing protein n=1 Tax=Aphis glycines TaxID=307491 RepID=A0A6G0T7J9_APHGL|nr:hypothetical protein AGLY_013035 [Aphis glycines]